MSQKHYERIAELAAEIVREDECKGDVKYVHLGQEKFRELVTCLHAVGAISSKWLEEE